MATCSTTTRLVPLPRPQVTPAGTFAGVATLDVELVEDGARGVGRARCLDAVGAEAIADALHGWLGDIRVAEVLGRAHRGRHRAAAWASTWDAVAPSAAPGPSTMALAALDEAVWELAEAETGTVVAPLAPGVRAPLYWSGLWLHSSPEELVAETRWAVRAGFDAVKVRVDGGDVGASVDRARRVLAELPWGRTMALELAGSGTPDAAVELVEALGPHRLLWVEDPLPPGQEGALAALVARLRAPVATGEDCWGIGPLWDLVVSTGVAIPIVDLGRAGGPSAPARFLEGGAVGCREVGVHIDARAACVRGGAGPAPGHRVARGVRLVGASGPRRHPRPCRCRGPRGHVGLRPPRPGAASTASNRALYLRPPTAHPEWSGGKASVRGRKRLVAVLLVGATVLAACGDDDSTAGDAGDGAATTAGGAAATTVAGGGGDAQDVCTEDRKGGELTMGVGAGLARGMDPTIALGIGRGRRQRDRCRLRHPDALRPRHRRDRAPRGRGPGAQRRPHASGR